MNYLKRLRARHWTWVSVLVIAGIWWPLFIITSPPEFIRDIVSPAVVEFCMGVALFGTVVKIFGYLFSQMPGRIGVIGISIELAGLILASVGPVSYLVTYLYALAVPNSILEFGSAFIFAAAVCAMFIHRAVIIVPRFLFEAHDSAKDDI